MQLIEIKNVGVAHEININLYKVYNIYKQIIKFQCPYKI